MIENYEFQDRAVEFLLNTCRDPKSKQTIVLKAPTGAGKTVILLKFIDKYLNSNESNTAFVWLCPGKGDLEEQSKNSMEQIFPNRKTFHLFDVLLNGFEAGTTTFINWEKVTKKGNTALLDGEKKNLYERIVAAHKSGIQFVIIIDEEHSNNTAKASDLIDFFAAKNIVRVSATTVKNKNCEFYEIDEEDVIDAELITKAISVNEGVVDGSAEDDLLLLELANQKRQEIRELYRKMDKKINPLVLIQFPNGNDEKIRSIEEKLAAMGYTRENKMVAAWLSGDKADIPDDLVENDSQLSFLFIKQAINTGWDCPRAKILVKLREGGDEAFQVQTIGRIRRMPERKFYDVTALDMCYVYTFDREYKQGLLAGLDKAYVPKRLFLKEKCKSDELVKELRDLDAYSVDMRTVYTQIRNFFVKKYILDNDKELNKQKLIAAGFRMEHELIGSVVGGVFVVTDSLADSLGTTETRTPVNTHEHGMELRHTIDQFKNILGVPANAVRQIMDRLFCFKYRNRDKILSLGLKEYYAFVINNRDIIKNDLREVAAEVSAQNTIIQPKTITFRLPDEEFYHYDSDVKNEQLIESNAYKEYTTGYVTSNCGKSGPEIMFEDYCESKVNTTVDWVYKNGDSGQQYFSIVYYDGIQAKQKLFYPDYIVKLVDGSIWIIETKGGQTGEKSNNIDKQIENKFNTFKRYAEQYKVNWGFVRCMDNKLYINNTVFDIDMHADSWVPLNTAF